MNRAMKYALRIVAIIFVIYLSVFVLVALTGHYGHSVR